MVLLILCSPLLIICEQLNIHLTEDISCERNDYALIICKAIPQKVEVISQR